jgi:hypothetical protein
MFFIHQKKLTKRASNFKFFLLMKILILSLASCGGGGGEGQGPDPLAIDIPIAFVERPIPIDDSNSVEIESILEPVMFNGGAKLFLRERASQTANSTNITDRQFGTGSMYDVKDVEVSYDGLKLIFSMRAPQDENLVEALRAKWNIWIYDIETDELYPMIASSGRAEEGHDISPAFLPDGRIIFSSTRQTLSRPLLINELKPIGSNNGSGFTATIDDVEIFNLHIADPINDPIFANIQQITFSQGHDIQATVLQDGRIAFLRYDAINDNDNLSIYTINSDGSNMRILYGHHSQATGDSTEQTSFIDFRELADGSLIAILQARESALLGGDIIRINTPEFTDINQATHSNRSSSGVGQQSLTPANINLDNLISVNGLYNSVYPFSDGSMNAIVGRNLCSLIDPNNPQEVFVCTEQNLQNPNLEGAPPNYGVWTFNVANNTIVPIVIAPTGTMYTDSVILEPRLTPPLTVADASTFSSSLEGEGLAILNIRSVYDTDGIDVSNLGIGALSDPGQISAVDRPARFIRIIKPVSLPSDDVLDESVPNFDNAAFGISQARGMREIIGYAPIEPDGSVGIKTPSGFPFTFDIVDAQGTRIAPLHRNTLQLKAGEAYNCTGCHSRDSELPHGRIDAEAPSANAGGQRLFFPFTNTNPNLFINEVGETMADVYTRIEGARNLSTGLEFTDEWTNSALLPLDPDIRLLYRDSGGANGLSTPPPVTAACENSLQPACRIVINYRTHIQPLWETSRMAGGDDNQCTACHSRSNAGVAQTPAGQLELTDEASAVSLQIVSYRELLQQGAPVIIGNNGLLLTLFVQAQDGAGVFQIQRLENGDPILDSSGDPIPIVRNFSSIDDSPNNILINTFTEVPGQPGVYATDIYLDSAGMPILDAGGNEINLLTPIPAVNVPSNENAIMASNAANSRFFDVTSNATGGSVDHSGFMNENELRLLREWIDIGAQYYNNPFDVP